MDLTFKKKKKKSQSPYMDAGEGRVRVNGSGDWWRRRLNGFQHDEAHRVSARKPYRVCTRKHDN